MYDFVIRNALLLDDQIKDIAIKDGKIHTIGECKFVGKKEIDLHSQYYVSAGWMDAHTHCFSQSPIYHDEPDCIGIEAGVTSVVDAGSTGAVDIAEFYKLSKKSSTNVYAFLNISKIGLLRQNELADLDDLDEELLGQVIAKYSDFIVGLKVRMSKSVIGNNGIEPLLRAKAMQKKYGLPLMIHIGNTPPDLEEIADLLDCGDIITHCFNGKPNKILDDNHKIRLAIVRAIERGVILDIGHGRESFSFNVAEKAKDLDIYPTTISSDIYSANRLNGPVYSLATVMTKFLCLDYSKERIINSVTQNAAKILRLPNKGSLIEGFDADLTIFTLKQEPILLTDAEGETRKSKEQFTPLASVVNGKLFITTEGDKYGLKN